MLLSLRSCKSLGPSDAIHIAVDHILDLYQEIKQGKETNAPIVDPERILTTRLIEFIESLPRAYEFRVTLPSFPNWGAFELELAPGIRLIGQPEPEPPLLNGLLALTISSQIQPTAKRGVSLVFEMRGFASSNADSPVPTDAIALLKLTSFLLVTQNVLLGIWNSPLATASVIDRLTGKSEDISLPEGLARHIGGLQPNTEALQVFDAPAGASIAQLLTAPKRAAATDAERVEVLSTLLKPIARVLNLRKGAAFRPLEAAIEWHQDSHFTQDQTIAYLAACIGLEALFGEPDMNEMSKRLQDRYAFLLGKSREDRARLAHEYEQVLRIRGHLVHARVKRLSTRDAKSLATARKMLKDSILHELQRL